MASNVLSEHHCDSGNTLYIGLGSRVFKFMPKMPACNRGNKRNPAGRTKQNAIIIMASVENLHSTARACARTRLPIKVLRAVGIGREGVRGRFKSKGIRLAIGTQSAPLRFVTPHGSARRVDGAVPGAFFLVSLFLSLVSLSQPT